ncbi:hypothetical protein ILUMI_17922 [Ignelater luminosus]|uniref:Uncharacterized protein n=1 Tax=Ignelater luminosus TaxID=2038154 RepID=A0A8K0CNM1_IGNLU|nr:hypothetical protein ILUMI_17922 [Ignelater luminosus]
MLIHILIVLSSIDCSVLLALANTLKTPDARQLELSKTNEISDLNVNTSKKVSSRRKTPPIIDSGRNKNGGNDSRARKVEPDYLYSNEPEGGGNYMYEEPIYSNVGK